MYREGLVAHYLGSDARAERTHAAARRSITSCARSSAAVRASRTQLAYSVLDAAAQVEGNDVYCAGEVHAGSRYHSLDAAASSSRGRIVFARVTGHTWVRRWHRLDQTTLGGNGALLEVLPARLRVELVLKRRNAGKNAIA